MRQMYIYKILHSNEIFVLLIIGGSHISLFFACLALCGDVYFFSGTSGGSGRKGCCVRPDPFETSAADIELHFKEHEQPVYFQICVRHTQKLS